MAQPNIRNLEGDSLYIDRWWTGEYTNRNPLYVPVSSMGLQAVARRDVLADGLNVELSPQMTLVRRGGFPRYCSTAFGSSDWPLAFTSFKNLSGTIKLLVDTPTKVVSFTTSAQTTVYSKGSSAQTSFQKVGSTIYMCNGTDVKKWDQTTVTNWGFAGAVTAPTISFSVGSLSPKSGYKYVYVGKNNTTGHVSSASPASAKTGPQTSKEIVLGGARFTDAQVDKVSIYRTLDGGSLY